jgi:hypothetical protein
MMEVCIGRYKLGMFREGRWHTYAEVNFATFEPVHVDVIHLRWVFLFVVVQTR